MHKRKSFAEQSKNIIFLVQSLVIVAALSAKIQVAPHDGSSAALLVVLAKLRESFEIAGIADVLIFVMLALAFRESERRGIKKHARLYALSFVLAVIYVLSLSSKYLGNSSFVLANSYQLAFSLLCIVGYTCLLELVLRWIYHFAENVYVEVSGDRNDLKLWLKSFAVIFVCLLPWLFASYPATFCPDSISQLNSFFGITPWDGNSPTLSTVVMGACVSLGEIIKDRNFGCFIYVLMQTAVCAAVFAYSLVLLRRMGLKKGAWFAALLYYSVNPIWGAYAQWFEKDTLYMAFFTLAMVQLIDICRSKSCSGRRMPALIFSLIMASLLRNNGRFEVLPFALGVCFLLNGADRRRMASVFAASVAVIICAGSIIYPALGVGKSSPAELLSIPFQQTARYAAVCGDEVTEQEREVIDGVLDYDVLAERYFWLLSDPVKSTYHGDTQALKEYFRVWARMGVKHPSVYLDAFLGTSYGYLAPVEPETEPPIPCYEYEEMPELKLTRKSAEIPTALAEVYWCNAGTFPVIRTLYMPGFYSWIVIICAVFLRMKKKYAAMLPLIPGLINVFMCVFSAMHNGTRYDLQVIATAPLLIWWTVINLHPENKEE